jgi:hypothetical protein
MASENTIKIASYYFSCPACGHLVKKGENYIDSEGVALCVCAMPVRRLIATGIRRLAIRQKTKA